MGALGAARSRSGDGGDQTTPTTNETSPLLIAIASSTADRIRLAELVDDFAPILLVSSVHEVRAMLERQLVSGASTVPVAAVRRGAETTNVLTLDSVRYVLRWMDREVRVTTLEHDLL